ncbi:hypothetical protein S7711_10755 [Stachybotrys chartarum IBT 7711]|uniref:Uncharacterized protein n=1 Tax=Stachybotrys chartarum (strain CBS 109288 / IBT 7711) TaxID=1280523 RepID=A0A084B7M9_STACB|nr:hypothetical protein S7711_10755 [Stachybotrys chartarum IBT 7711]KFA48268.1 hypothetical protein S40293_11169 [Stachybotrys chartarum IBT 40293]KFA80733.1 hypothetical protein S40288_10650 [Stachybotrys chartarum IBT 40288]
MRNNFQRVSKHLILCAFAGQGRSPPSGDRLWDALPAAPPLRRHRTAEGVVVALIRPWLCCLEISLALRIPYSAELRHITVQQRAASGSEPRRWRETPMACIPRFLASHLVLGGIVERRGIHPRSTANHHEPP